MPDSVDQLSRGIRFEKSGVLDRALGEYDAVLASSDDPRLVAEAWRRRSSVLRTRCEWEGALEAARRSAEVATGAALWSLVGEALNAEAAVHESRGDFDRAVELLERVATITDDERVVGIALHNLGGIAAQSGDLEVAEARFTESHARFRRAGYAWGEAFALNNLGRTALDRGEVARAESLLVRAIAAAQSAEDLDLKALATLNRAEALARMGRLTEAEDHASGALGFFTFAGNDWRRIECLRLLGDLCSQQGNGDAAMRCFTQALDLARAIGAERERELLERKVAGEGEADGVVGA
ncbi:MAG TPA: tetratricopeptide repeat protein [Gemmatimonadaceae bacterium]